MGLVTQPVQMPITVVNKWSKGFAALHADINKMTSKVGKFNKAMVQSSALVAQKGQQLKKTGQNMTAFGKNMTTKVTAPILALGAIGVKSFADLEKGMKEVASLGLADERIESLTKNVDRMSVHFAKDTTDMTSGLYEVVSAFGDMNKAGNDTTTKLRINAEAAAAGLATTQESIKLTSAVTKAYGDTTNAAVQNVADMAFKTVELGQTTFPELAASIGEVTPLANQLKISQEELFGVFATGTGVLGSASKVSTQFKAILGKMMNPTKDLNKLYNKFGVEGGEQFIKKQGSLANAMKAIIDHSKKHKIALKDLLPSIEAQNLALSMAGTQYDNLLTKTAKMQKAQGASAKAFQKQSESFSFQAAQFQQMFLSMARDIGVIVIPVLIDVMKTIKPMIKSFKQASPATKKMIVMFAGIAAAAGPVIMMIGSMVTAVGGLMTAYGAIAPVIGTIVTKLAAFKAGMVALPALINPVTVAIAGFTAGFLGGLKIFEKFFTNIRNSKHAPKWVKEFANDWLNGFEVLKDYFPKFITWTTNIFKKMGEIIYNHIMAPVKLAIKGVELAVDALPTWVKEGMGIDINDNTSGNTASSQPLSAEQVTKLYNQTTIERYSVEKQQQDINLNIANAPVGSTVESKGADLAMLDIGFAQ